MTHHPILALAAALTLAGLAGCGSNQDTPSIGTTAITATDSTCQVAATSLPAGKTAFQATNKGSKTTEVYIYGQQNGAYTKIIAEVEDIGPGTSRALSADLSGGTYEIACKPGQTGDGIRTRITVAAGDVAASSTPSAQAAAYDREIEIEVTTGGVEGADGLTATAGQKIEFKLENKANGKRELELIDPAGKKVAVIEADPSGAAETIVTLAPAGTWTLKIEGAGSEVEKKLTVA